MVDNGGPVETAPKIYLDFWGWSSDPSGEAPYLTSFLSSVGGTSWLATVNQYGAGSQSGLLAGTWSDPAAAPTAPTDAQIQQEAARAANHFATGTSVNVQIVVATPSGQSTAGFGSSFCAYHGAISTMPSVTYTNLPYMTDMGTKCGENSVHAGAAGALDGVSIVEGHELAETITDPLLNAWYDPNGQEIGDKCAWVGLADITTTSGTFAMQPLWSNAASACVLGSTRSGTILAWGAGTSYELGNGSSANTSVAVAGPSLSGVTAVAAGENTAYAVLSDGTVHSWGSPAYGTLGDGGPTYGRFGPTQVSGLTNVTAISAGEQSAFALRSDGTVWAWGWNGYGQLGNGTTTDSGVPVQVTGLTGVVGIASANRAAYAVRSDGTVWSWGFNNFGQLGNGTTTNSSVPVQVSGLNNVSAVAAGFQTGYALKSDGSVWSWGGNTAGDLGTGATFPNLSTTAVQVAGLTGVTAISAAQSGYALKNDGTVWAWGSGAHGGLGDGSVANSATPVRVSGLTGVTAIRGNPNNYATDTGYAVRSDGTEWSWGYNAYGQLGNGSTADSSVPVQVSGVGGVLAIGASAEAGYAVVD